MEDPHKVLLQDIRRAGRLTLTMPLWHRIVALVGHEPQDSGDAVEPITLDDVLPDEQDLYDRDGGDR